MRFGSLGLIIIGTQLNGNAKYLGPALVFTLLDFLLSLVLAIEIGRKTSRVENPAGRCRGQRTLIPNESGRELAAVLVG